MLYVVIDRLITSLSIAKTECSYAAYLLVYVLLKKEETRITRQINFDGLSYHYKDNLEKIKLVREKMYENPCKNCHYCNSRRKKWN